MIGTKVASMILDSRQLNFYKVNPTASGNCALFCQPDKTWKLRSLIRLPKPCRVLGVGSNFEGLTTHWLREARCNADTC